MPLGALSSRTALALSNGFNLSPTRCATARPCRRAMGELATTVNFAESLSLVWLAFLEPLPSSAVHWRGLPPLVLWNAPCYDTLLRKKFLCYRRPDAGFFFLLDGPFYYLRNKSGPLKWLEISRVMMDAVSLRGVATLVRELHFCTG